MKISARFKAAVWAVLVCAWLGQSLTAENSLNADAVAYLDIAYSCLRGNWHALVNGYWSPGYPFLLALCVKLFGVGPFHEALAVHLFAVASLIVALGCFEYFLAVFFSYRRKFAEGGAQVGASFLADDAIRLVGYALFFWISTFLTPPYLDQPDILVFALYLLATAFSMQLLAGSGEWWRYALLGVVLGLGYLTKAVMFPLAFSFLAVLLLRREWLRVLPKVLLTLAVFAAVSAPFIRDLSRSKGRLTYGDVGVVAYRHIMGMDTADAAHGAAAFLPMPAAAPHAMEFTETLQLGTYPPWADPSYGYHGAPVHFNLRRQINRTHVVLRYYFDLYIGELGALFAGFLALLICSGSAAGFAKRLLSQTALWFPAVTGLGLYAVMRVEGRMLAGFTIALFAACAAALCMEDADWARKMCRAVVIAVSLILASQSAVAAGHELVKLPVSGNSPDWQVATALRGMGVEPGERVSYLGYALIDHAWAHMARVKISAEIPDEDVSSFWAASEEQRAAALAWLAATGAKALVTRGVPGTAISMGWKRVDDTDYYILQLPEKGAR
ncbi:MAG: glycosyltransferase family 39 protein [Candidatus Acidiferrales bacterium]